MVNTNAGSEQRKLKAVTPTGSLHWEVMNGNSVYIILLFIVRFRVLLCCKAHAYSENKYIVFLHFLSISCAVIFF
jgi:hypothetical protein